MILSASNLSCHRGGRPVFRDISFRLTPGQALVITGDNGAGKSSLLAMIAGLLPCKTGAITLDDNRDRTLGELVGLMGSRDGLKPSLSVKENLLYAQGLLGASSVSVEAALQIVGLEHAMDMPVEHLSAGQRRRISLARLLACDRPIWLMDEPAGALDHRSIGALTNIMEKHIACGGIIIATTHQPLGLSNFATLHLEQSQTEVDTEHGYWEDELFDDDQLTGYRPAKQIA